MPNLTKTTVYHKKMCNEYRKITYLNILFINSSTDKCNLMLFPDFMGSS